MTSSLKRNTAQILDYNQLNSWIRSDVTPFLLDRLPLIYVFLSGVGFSFQTLFVKLLAQQNYTASFTIVFYRGVIQCLLSGWFVYFNEERLAGNGPKICGNTTRITVILVLRAIAGFGSTGCTFLALEMIPLGDGTVLSMMSPLVAAIGCYLVLGEPWRLTEFIATIVALFGALLVAKPPLIFGSDDSETQDSQSSRYFYLGVFVALAASFCGGMAYTCIRLLGTTAKMPWANVLFAQGLGQLILGPPVAIILGQRFLQWFTWTQIGLISGAGLMGAICQVGMTIGMQREKGATVTAMRMSDVVFSFLWQSLFTKESVSLLSVFGAFIITASILMMVIFKQKNVVLDASSGNVELGSTRKDIAYEFVPSKDKDIEHENNMN